MQGRGAVPPNQALVGFYLMLLPHQVGSSTIKSGPRCDKTWWDHRTTHARHTTYHDSLHQARRHQKPRMYNTHTRTHTHTDTDTDTDTPSPSSWSSNQSGRPTILTPDKQSSVADDRCWNDSYHRPISHKQTQFRWLAHTQTFPDECPCLDPSQTMKIYLLSICGSD